LRPGAESSERNSHDGAEAPTDENCKQIATADCEKTPGCKVSGFWPMKSCKADPELERGDEGESREGSEQHNEIDYEERPTTEDCKQIATADCEKTVGCKVSGFWPMKSCKADPDRKGETEEGSAPHVDETDASTVEDCKQITIADCKNTPGCKVSGVWPMRSCKADPEGKPEDQDSNKNPECKGLQVKACRIAQACQVRGIWPQRYCELKADQQHSAGNQEQGSAADGCKNVKVKQCPNVPGCMVKGIWPMRKCTMDPKWQASEDHEGRSEQKDHGGHETKDRSGEEDHSAFSSWDHENGEDYEEHANEGHEGEGGFKDHDGHEGKDHKGQKKRRGS
jgi:hypothetical protein